MSLNSNNKGRVDSRREDDFISSLLDRGESISAREIVLLRRQSLNSATQRSLPSILAQHLEKRLKEFLKEKSNLSHLRSALKLILHLSKEDATLAEELGREGAHTHILQIINYPSSDDDDNMLEIQDLAGEIAGSHGSFFPSKKSPMMREELLSRLPLLFTFKRPESNTSMEKLATEALNEADSLNILISQVTTRQSAQEDVGFVMWPSAVILSQFMLFHKEEWLFRTNAVILELGAGCGLTGLVAAYLINEHHESIEASSDLIDSNAQQGNCRVILSDFNRTVIQNLQRNIALNDVSNVCGVVGLDFYQQQQERIERLQDGDGRMMESWNDIDGNGHPKIDLVIGADIICQPEDATAIAHTLDNVLVPGGKAYIVCADAEHRFGVDTFPSACGQISSLKMTSIQNVRDLLEQMEELKDLNQTTGYVRGMNMTLFSIEKCDVTD